MPVSLGLFTALYGIVFAAAQTDMKRLLAYSSIKNIGILFTGIGLAIVFHGVGRPQLAALALVAVLYHSVNHAFMKSLLFLGTGVVLHATGERNLGRLGGLIHRMPWVAWLTLVGALAIAGLPPLNGFVSEWLLLQAFLFAFEVPHTFVNMLLPLGAGLVALTAALVGLRHGEVLRCGVPRPAARGRSRPRRTMPVCWSARPAVARGGLRALGLLPAQIVPGSPGWPSSCDVGRLPRDGAPWWMLAPLQARQASYAPLVFFCAVVACPADHLRGAPSVSPAHPPRPRAWDCGFGRLDARMQDTAEGFGQPIRHLFEPFFAMQRQLPSPFDPAPRYRVVDRRPHLECRCTRRWVRWCSASPMPSQRCSRGASRRICCTVSSR